MLRARALAPAALQTLVRLHRETAVLLLQRVQLRLIVADKPRRRLIVQPEHNRYLNPRGTRQAILTARARNKQVPVPYLLSAGKRRDLILSQLADPGIIGISSGASFAAVLITAFAPTLFFFTPLFAFLGGVIAFVLVYSLSWKGGLSPLRIILVGVAVDAMFTGLSSALNSMNGGNMSGVAAIVNGNITMKTWDDVKTLVPYVIVGLILALIMTKMCNLLALEDKTARSLGINVNAMRIVISLIAVLLASISTAVAGVISFLGLIVPHIGRILVGSDHKALVPFSALFGAFTFLLADTIGRTIAAPYEVSASIIMSVVGGPFFIILLRRSKKYAK